jgi:hypothetical protein
MENHGESTDVQTYRSSEVQTYRNTDVQTNVAIERMVAVKPELLRIVRKSVEQKQGGGMVE